MIAMEDLKGLREKMRFSKRLNRRVHSMPYRRLQTIIEYKANLEGIEVRYVNAKNTSKICHRCGHVARKVDREFKCPNCRMEYDRDLNACINMAHRVTSSRGWGSREPPQPAREGLGEKPFLNTGTPAKAGGSSRDMTFMKK